MTQTIAKLLIGKPSLQLKSQLRFPGQIIGGGTISVTMLNGVATISTLNLVGDVTSLANVTTVGKINGTSLSGLATGILKNTTATGVPSIAVASDFPILNQNTTGNAATVTTNANLNGPITSVGNVTAVASQTGTGSKFVMDTSPTLVTPALGTPTALTLTNATGLPLSGLSNQAAYTFVGNNTGSAAAPTAVDIAALTTKASPAATDYIMLSDQAATGAWKKATVSSLASVGSVSSIAGNTGAFTLSRGVVNVVNDLSVEQMNPGGRLTLTSGSPVMATSVTAATTLYYAPMAGKYIPISSSGIMRLYDFTASVNDAVGLSIVLGANWAANSNYDVFVALNGGVVTLGTGPDWSAGAVAGSNAVGASVRGTGAGSTDLQINKGFLTNKNSMTLRFANASTFVAAANEATYLGTFRTGSAGQISFTYGTVGTAGTFNLWNAYNQVLLLSTSSDATANWTYVTATFRQANASAVNQFNFVTGLASGSIDASYMVAARAAAAVGAQPRAGLALNSVTTADVYGHIYNGASTIFDSTITAINTYKGQIGANYISAIELGDGTNSNLFYGSPQQALRVGLAC